MPTPEPAPAGRPDGPDAELTTVGQDSAGPDSAGQDSAGQDTAGSDRGRTDWTVPTMDDMRDKIDARSALAAGQSELDQLSSAGKQRALTTEARDKAAQDRLAAIRASLNEG